MRTWMTTMKAMATVALAGCAAVSRPPATVASVLAETPTLEAAERAMRDTILDGLARRAVRRGDARLDVLVLSGGGQHGAYGAAFLRAWRARPDAPMPTWDLVTGVSTGALQAPFALAGTAAALDTLVALYRNSADGFAPSLDRLFWLRKTGGVVDVGRYRATIAGTLGGPLGAAVAAARAEDRQLVVATADADVGRRRTWELTRLLAAGDTARARTLLYASSAIPGLFPPVVLDGHVHVDGGVMGNIAPVLDLDAVRALAARLRARGVTTPVTVRVHVIMNVWTVAPPVVVDIASRTAVGARGNALLFWMQQREQLARLHELAEAARAAEPLVRLEVRHVAVPDALRAEEGAARLFDARWMARLDSLGAARARAAQPWDAGPETSRPL